MVNLEVVKSADRNYVFIGSSNKIRYSISITNFGDERINSLKIKDILSKGACVIPNTLIINGCSQYEFRNETINIGCIDPGENIVISFDVNVEPNCPPDVITNKAIVTYKDKYNNIASIESNQLNTPVINIDVCLTKSVDKKIAKVGDIISYSVLIRNNSNVDINKVIFYDKLPENLILLPASVLIGAEPQYIDSFNEGLDIGTINAKSSVVVSFQVQVLCLPSPSKITNVAKVNYDYTIIDNGIHVTSIGESTSNCVTIRIISCECSC